MAAPVASLLRILKSAKALVESIFSAEKTKIPAIKSEANDLFQVLAFSL
jgi:hypothetical protein